MKIRKLFVLIILFLIIAIGIFFISRKKQKNQRPNVKIPIILYHHFVTQVPEKDPDNFSYINTPQSFEENVKVLLDNGYTTISMKELNDAYNGKMELPEKPILIHFDDGYYSNYEYIYPILKKYNIKASIYVVTDFVGKEINGSKYLGWDECKEMQNSGLVEIYSHSKRHVFYNRLPVNSVSSDVLKSYKIIEKNLGEKNFKAFVYPYGAYTKKSVFILKLLGIDMQVYDLGINNFKNLNRDYIKRINIPLDMTGKEIIQEIEKDEF